MKSDHLPENEQPNKEDTTKCSTFFTLEELIEQITAENKRDEVDTGDAVGNEAI